jgi:hypothetical protein
MILGSAFDLVFVPAGFEFRTVQKALLNSKVPSAVVRSIPIGPKALSAHLHHLVATDSFPRPASRILLMGLGGGLNEDLHVGDAVLIQQCGEVDDNRHVHWQVCDDTLDPAIAPGVFSVSSGRLISTDHVVSTISEKTYLSSHYRADVVDMEGFTALHILSEAGHLVSILRVVSDDCHHELPDFSAIVSPTGSLLPLKLVFAFLMRPLAALHLITGSLQGLKSLRLLTLQLFLHDS